MNKRISIYIPGISTIATAPRHQKDQENIAKPRTRPWTMKFMVAYFHKSTMFYRMHTLGQRDCEELFCLWHNEIERESRSMKSKGCPGSMIKHWWAGVGLNRWKVLENDEHVFLDSIYLGLFGVRWFKPGTRLSTGRFRDGQVKKITEKMGESWKSAAFSTSQRFHRDSSSSWFASAGPHQDPEKIGADPLISPGSQLTRASLHLQDPGVANVPRAVNSECLLRPVDPLTPPLPCKKGQLKKGDFTKPF